jgi:rhomboid protease GluP
MQAPAPRSTEGSADAASAPASAVGSMPPSDDVSAAESEAAEHAAAQARAFDERLERLTPSLWALWLMMGLCIAVWAATGVAGMSLLEPRADELYRWGANSASGVQAGQAWRLFTAMFLHGGVMHLAFNMYALLQAGILVTQLFGNVGFLVIYLGAGLVGNALSLHYAAQAGVSVGASGAVFGVAGALLVAVLQHRGRFPIGRPRQLLISMGFFVVFSLLYGLKDGIDNAAHVGGLLAGGVAGWLLVEKIDDATAGRRAIMMVAAIAVCLGTTAALVATTPPAARDTATYYADLHRFNALKPRLDAALNAFNDDLTQNKAGRLATPDFLARVDAVHVPAVRSVAADYASLRLPAEELVGRYAAAYARFASAVAAKLETDNRYSREPSPDLDARRQTIANELAQARAAIGQLNTETGRAKKQGG